MDIALWALQVLLALLLVGAGGLELFSYETLGGNEA